MTPHDGTLADLAAAVEAGLLLANSHTHETVFEDTAVEAHEAFAAYRQRTEALERTLRWIADNAERGDVGKSEIAQQAAQALLTTPPADGELTINKGGEL